MNALRNYLDKIKPNFEEGGKFHAFRSVFDGFETFLFVPNTTSKTGTHIHDAIDSKRIMSFVVIALIPALPKAWVHKIGLERVRVFFSGDNLWTGTSINKNFDPEALYQNGMTYPLSRTLSCGVNVTL